MCRVVLDYADAVSTTTPTPCPHSQQLCQHPVSVVNNYADTISAKSTTTRGHGVGEAHDYVDINFHKYQITFFVTFLLVFYLFKSKIISCVSA